MNMPFLFSIQSINKIYIFPQWTENRMCVDVERILLYLYFSFFLFYFLFMNNLVAIDYVKWKEKLLSVILPLIRLLSIIYNKGSEKKVFSIFPHIRVFVSVHSHCMYGTGGLSIVACLSLKNEYYISLTVTHLLCVYYITITS